MLFLDVLYLQITKTLVRVKFFFLRKVFQLINQEAIIFNYSHFVPCTELTDHMRTVSGYHSNVRETARLYAC